MKKALKLLGRILAVLLALILCLALVMIVVPLTETGDKTPVPGSADWMAQLPDDKLLSEIVIPGTHDSATEYVDLAFFSKCQAMDVGRQLRAGYRYLDIRLAADGERMKLMHGFVSCRESWLPWSEELYLDGVLESCYAFLDENPSETVIFAVKQEHGNESTAEFQRILKGYTDKNPEKWLLTDRIPSLGEARGKLVLMRRYEDSAELGSAAGISMVWGDQVDRDPSLNTVAWDNGYTLWVQDRYKLDADDKWNAFLAGMANSVSGAESVSLNFLSTNGTPAYGHPFGYARDLNARFAELDTGLLKGWIILDFADAALAERIYTANF